MIKDFGSQAIPRPSKAMVFNKKALGAMKTTEMVLSPLLCEFSEYSRRIVDLRILPKPEASLYSNTGNTDEDSTSKSG